MTSTTETKQFLFGEGEGVIKNKKKKEKKTVHKNAWRDRGGLDLRVCAHPRVLANHFTRGRAAKLPQDLKFKIFFFICT